MLVVQVMLFVPFVAVQEVAVIRWKNHKDAQAVYGRISGWGHSTDSDLPNGGTMTQRITVSLWK